MNSGIAMAILAVLLQLADKPEPTADTAMELAREYRPDAVYAGASVLNDTVVYSGGATWKTGKRYGIGAEYRNTDKSVTLLGLPHELQTHTGGVYLYRDLPAWGDLSVRTDVGMGVVYGESDTLKTDNTWAVSGRALGVLALTDSIDFMMYFAGIYLGDVRVSDQFTTATIKAGGYPEAGVALAMGF